MAGNERCRDASGEEDPPERPGTWRLTGAFRGGGRRSASAKGSASERDVLVAFIALQTSVVAAWWRWLSPRAAGLTAAERLLCASVLAVAQIVGASLLLGWCGLLAPLPLLLAVLIGSGLLALSPLPPGGDRGEGMSPEAAPSKALSRGNLALVLLLLPTLALVVARGVHVPSFGWDGLNYHLPMSALMLQTGRFDFPPAHEPTIAAYPKTGEIWSHWFLAFFRDDRWVGVAQLPFLLVAMLATGCAARRLGASRAASMMAALLLPFAPVVLTQITVAYTDIILAALVLTVVALVLAAHGAPALPLAVGAALGLLLGTKFTALVLAPLLYVAFALAVLRARGRRGLPALVVAALLAALLGGDTYLRNWRQHGNPVFPYRTTVLGWPLPGPRELSHVYGVAETRDAAPLARHLRSWSAVGVVGHSQIYGGFGVTGPFLAGVSAVALALAVRERDGVRLAVSALFAALTALTPVSFRLRFVIFLLGFGGICLSHVLDRAGPRLRAALVVAVLAVALATSAQIWRRELPALWHAGAARADPCREAEPPAFRPAYTWLRANAPAGSTVLVLPGVSRLFAYCLWTPAFTNRVEFVDAAVAADPERLTETTPGAILFLPHGSPASAHVAADPARWRILFADAAVTLATR